jgi:hypothetical protein
MRPIALAGRVPVKVNLEGGLINPGDRIALSSVPGVGKRAGLFDSSVGIAMDTYDGANADANGIGQVIIFLDIEQGVDLNSVGDVLLGTTTPNTIATSTSATTTIAAAMGTTTELTGNDFLGRVFAAIIARLEGFGIFINETMTRFTNLFADHLTVGSPDQPAGITLFDQATRDPYCVVVNQGQLISLAGACGDSTSSLPQMLDNVGGDASTTDDYSTPTPPSSGSSTTTAPILSVNGSNPAQIAVGAAYVDLGATIVGPAADINLGVMAAVDGGEPRSLDQIYIDTSAPGTHTIIYSATDQSGLVGSASREVVVYEPNAASSTPLSAGTSTSTSTSTPPVVDAGTATSSAPLTTGSTSPAIDSGTASSTTATSTQP